MRKSILAVWGLSATAAVAGALDMLYPNLVGKFGSTLNVGKKSAFPAARPGDFKVNQAGVFYRQIAKTYNDSAAIGPFNTAGTYHLYCTIHQNMNLTVIVQ